MKARSSRRSSIGPDHEVVDQAGGLEAGDALGRGEHAHGGDPPGVAAPQQLAGEG